MNVSANSTVPPTPAAISMSTRMLIAGGLPETRIQLLGQLRCNNCPVLEVADPWRAIDLLRQRAFDLLLLGIDTPDVDALQVLRDLKADRILRGLPVILFAAPHAGEMTILSASGQASLIERGIALGADDYYLGPWEVDGSTLTERSMIGTLLKTRLDIVLAHKQHAEIDEQFKSSQRLANDLINTILPLGLALSAEKNFEHLLERILLETRALCNADAGTLYLRTDDNRLRFAMMYTLSLNIALGGATGNPVTIPPLPIYDPETGEPNYSNVATHAALEGHSINVPDAYKSGEFDFAGAKRFDILNNYRTVSSLTVPLKDYDNEVIGVLQLINAKDSATGEIIPFSPYLQLVTESLASLASQALTNRYLLESQRKLGKMEQELEIGRKIQADFLPSQLPQPDGWAIAASFCPARQVAGDFFDAFYLPTGRLCFLIADVCDKGVGAALFMALIRSLIRAFAGRNLLSMVSGSNAADTGQGANDEWSAVLHNPQIISMLSDLTVLNTVTQTNNYLITNHSQTNMFATLFIGVLDPTSGMVTYVNAGHNPPMLVCSGDVKERLKATGPAVGMVPGAKYTIRQAQMKPGDLLFTFTDGVSEARAPDGEFFTEKRLTPLLLGPVDSPADLLELVDSRLTEHTTGADQSDDITMLAVLRRPTAA